MTRRVRESVNPPARPISTKRDYQGASTVAKRLAQQAALDSSAEQRLQALLREMDKFDDPEEEETADDAGDYEQSTPRRRWSDDESS